MYLIIYVIYKHTFKDNSYIVGIKLHLPFSFTVPDNPRKKRIETTYKICPKTDAVIRSCKLFKSNKIKPSYSSFAIRSHRLAEIQRLQSASPDVINTPLAKPADGSALIRWHQLVMNSVSCDFESSDISDLTFMTLKPLLHISSNDCSDYIASGDGNRSLCISRALKYMYMNPEFDDKESKCDYLSHISDSYFYRCVNLHVNLQGTYFLHASFYYVYTFI